MLYKGNSFFVAFKEKAVSFVKFGMSTGLRKRNVRPILLDLDNDASNTELPKL